MMLELKPRLLHPQTAMAALDVTEDELLRLLEVGQVQWGFNIARPGASRRCLRIAAHSVWAMQSDRAESLSFDELMRLLLPAHFCFFPARDLAKRFSMSNTQICDCVRAGVFKAEPKRRAKDVIRVHRRSVVEFLKARRVT
jgi:hypothetical protein